MAITHSAQEARRRFKEAFADSGGSVSDTAKILGVSARNANQMRRNIEHDEGILLLSTSPRSPDIDIMPVEFPEWDSLEVKNGYIICFGDAHLMPGIKSTAHRALLKLIPEIQPEALVDLGDLMDFASIGRHHKIGHDARLTVKREIEWAGDCLEEMVKLGPKRMRRKRTRGNHDQRFSGFFANRVPEMDGIKGIALEDHLPGWSCSWSIAVNETQAYLTHRWKSGLHGPFNNTLWSGVSTVTGHEHRQRVYPLTDLRGDRWGVDVGTVASVWWPHFRYGEGKPKNQRSGFVVLRFVNHILRHPELVRVIDEKNGLCEFRGKDFTV